MFKPLREAILLEFLQHLPACTFKFPIVTSTLEVLGCGTDGSALCISACVTPFSLGFTDIKL
jgi:hypothetical protein